LPQNFSRLNISGTGSAAQYQQHRISSTVSAAQYQRHHISDIESAARSQWTLIIFEVPFNFVSKLFQQIIMLRSS
jgi:hypothetical protein